MAFPSRRGPRRLANEKRGNENYITTVNCMAGRNAWQTQGWKKCSIVLMALMFLYMDSIILQKAA